MNQAEKEVDDPRIFLTREWPVLDEWSMV